MANVRSREEIAAPEGDAAEFISSLLADAAGGKKFAWHESFVACDGVRGVAIHAGDDGGDGGGAITQKNVKKLVALLCGWGGNSRSVLAHNALCAVADLLHFLPGTVAGSDAATAAAVELLLDTSKKNKAGVLKARVKTVLEEVANDVPIGSFDDDGATALVLAMFVPAFGTAKWAG